MKLKSPGGQGGMDLVDFQASKDSSESLGLGFLFTSKNSGAKHAELP